MSTESTEPPDMAKKKAKHKKNKGHTDNNTKKRKRDEQAEQEAADEQLILESQAQERAAKKQKNGQKKARFAAHSAQSSTSNASNGKPSPFVKQTTSLHLPLSPFAHDFAIEGLLAEHIAPLVLTYFAPLKGILLAYENPRISERPGGGVIANADNTPTSVLSRSVDEYGVTFVWLTAEWLVFKPQRGTYLEGKVIIQNESMLGLVCYNYFNAMIERDKLPEDWKWIEASEEGAQNQKKSNKKKAIEALRESGHFVDGEGKEIDSKQTFKVEDFDANQGPNGQIATVSIIGTLRLDDDES